MRKDNLTSEERASVSYYDSFAEDWSEKHGHKDHKSYFQEDFDKFTRILPKGRILEVGSGHGGDAKLLISHYGADNYIGLDASKGLLKIAREKNPRGNFQHKSIYELDFKEDSFDGFWVSAMLVHVPKNRLQEALGNLNRVTKVNGIGFISVMEGESDMQESRPGRFYTLWQKEEFLSELKRAGFEALNTSRYESGVSLSPWLAFIVRKV